jgi:hypothetical protein
MVFLQEAGLDQVIHQAGFQLKNGAAFAWQDRHTAFDFCEKFSDGPGTTYQVERARFDHLLADEVAARGARVTYGQEVLSFARVGNLSELVVRDVDEGTERRVRARFVLDASGFARVLPRLLGLDAPSSFPVRASLFCHVRDGIDDPAFDRNKILISVHPAMRDVWFWLIPFADGRSSLGVVAKEAVYAALPGSETEQLRALVAQVPHLQGLLAGAENHTPVRRIVGYSANVTSLYGDGFALLGNAGEFLDPVFSSGVTIAMKSAQLASAVLDRQLAGETVDWEVDYSVPLRAGVDCFRAYVKGWYDGRFQDIIFSGGQNERVREMISSILAGYAWDQKNPYVAESERRLDTLSELVRMRDSG